MIEFSEELQGSLAVDDDRAALLPNGSSEGATLLDIPSGSLGHSKEVSEALDAIDYSEAMRLTSLLDVVPLQGFSDCCMDECGELRCGQIYQTIFHC